MMTLLVAVLGIIGFLLFTSAAFADMAPGIKITKTTVTPGVNGSHLEVDVSVSNFTLAEKLGKPISPGQGHIHYFLDVQPPTAQGKPAVPAKGSVWAATAKSTYTFEGVAPGSHTVYVELVNNNHTPLNPPVVAKTTVNIASAADPSVTVDLTAQNISFDSTRIQVPAGASVTIKFTNRDNGIPHNFAVYESPAAKKSIFKGKNITGPDTITYTFTAPDKPGNYFFRCDVHPSRMTGTLVVQ
jgi:plastocyanin